VAADLAPLALGTETDGSIVCPAAVCGVVGFKPTVGLVSRHGVVPLSHSQDSVGPMARSVADAALLLQALSGPDPADPATQAAAAASAARALAGLERVRLKGRRIGVAREFFGLHRQADARIEHALQVLRDEGAVLVDPVEVVRDAAALGAAEYEVLLHEFKAGLDAYLAGRGAGTRVRSLADVIDFNEAHAERELVLFGQEHFRAAQARGPLTAPAYRRARATCLRLARRQGIDAALARHRLDAIVAPTTGPACLIDPVNGDHFLGACSQPAAVAGYPHVTVPAGQVFGLPIGLSLFGGAWQDARVLGLAHAYERASRMRQPPTFASSASTQP